MATQNYFASLTYNRDVMLKKIDASAQIDFSDSQISTSQTNCYSLSYISHAWRSKKIEAWYWGHVSFSLTCHWNLLMFHYLTLPRRVVPVLDTLLAALKPFGGCFGTHFGQFGTPLDESNRSSHFWCFQWFQCISAIQTKGLPIQHAMETDGTW